MKINTAISFAIILFCIKSIQNEKSDEYVTYRMGSASSQMNWVDGEGLLTFLDYYQLNVLDSQKCKIKDTCNSTTNVCLCDNFMICYQQNFTSCSEWLLEVTNTPANDTDDLFVTVNTLVLDDQSLDDIANYTGLLKNIVNLSITTNIYLKWNLTERLLNRTESLVSLTLVSLDSYEEFQQPVKVNLKGQSLKNLTYLNMAGFNEFSYFSWLKDSQIKAFRISQLLNTDTDLLLSYLPNTTEAIDLGSEISINFCWCGLENITRLPIKKLGLARLDLSGIPKTLQNISNTLQYLSLNGNNYEDLLTRTFKKMKTGEDDDEFINLQELLELDLRNCGISFLYEEMFHNMPKLRKLSLGSNQISFSIALGNNFLSAVNLVYLDVSNNRNEQLFGLTVDKVHDTKIFKNYVNNPVYVDLSYSNGVLYIPFITNQTTHLFLSYSSVSCTKRKKSLSSLQVLYLNNLLIDSKCYKELADNIISAKNLKELHFMSSNIDDIDMLNIISNFYQLKILNLRGNHIESITEQQTNPLKNLEVLDLSGNNIMTWRKHVFQKNSNLKELNVSSNKLTMITNEMLDDFKILKKLDISKNPLICNKRLQNLIDIFSEQKFQLFYSKEKFCSAEGHYLNYDEFFRSISEVTTNNSIPTNSNLGFVTLTDTNEYYHAYLIVIIIILIAFFVSSVLIYFRRYTISYYTNVIKITKGKIIFKRKVNKRLKSFHYDVFVSYSENDRAWVLEQLIPQLEVNGTHICLHERDFQVGMSILENIMDNMNKSRCLLLVISNSFIKSRWCQFEMNLAQFYRVEMKDRHIILIFLEQIQKTNRPKLLHYLMSTKTYLEWPQEKANKFDEERNRFFKRLSQALHHTSDTEEI